MIRLFLLAIQFLTIVPIPGVHARREDDFGRSMLLFPLAGGVIGLACALVDLSLRGVVPLSLRSGLVLITLVIVTGALHLDGVADLFDALGSRGDRETMLRVMKDSRIGAFGVIAIVLLLILKWLAIDALQEQFRFASLVLAPGIGRCAMTAVAAGAFAARSDGLGSLFAAGATLPILAGATLVTLAGGGLLCGVQGIAAVIAAVSFALLLRYHACRRLGGVTGDVIGAGGELSELLALIILCVRV